MLICLCDSGDFSKGLLQKFFELFYIELPNYQLTPAAYQLFPLSLQSVAVFAVTLSCALFESLFHTYL